MLSRILLFAAFLVLSAAGAAAQEEKGKVTLPEKEKFCLVVLAGQSNMAGRGKVEPEDRIPHPRVLMLNREGEWVPAVDPVHFDKSAAGVGLGSTFAKKLADSDPSITVGLIPTACGGSSINHWQPGVFFRQTNSHPYDDCMLRVKKALEVGTLTAVLWHQGESDCSKKMAPLYEEMLTELFVRFRTEWNAPNLPILIGELEQRPAEKYRAQITAAHKNIAKTLPNAAFVPSDGFTMNPDKIHFDRASLILFGERFWEAYQSLKEKE